jgi:exopolysaccharide production protein ExoQ
MSRYYNLASTFFLLHAMEAFGIVDRQVYGEWEGKLGDKITQGFNLLLIVTSLILFSRGFRKTRGIGAGGVLALTLAGFLLLSTLWSVDQGVTLRQAVLYLFLVVGSIGIANSMDGDEYMDLLGRACVLCAGASIVLLLVFPDAALMQGSNELRGIFSHKNFLGQVMVIGVLASLHGIRVGKLKRLRNAAMLVLFIIVALASKSATACVTIFALCSTDAIITFFRRGGARRLLAIASIMVLLPILGFAALVPDFFLEMIGKDPTLTNRTEIWELVFPYIYQRPLLGWGFLAFWSLQNPAAVQIADEMRWISPEAHNGLLDILLSVGLIGLAFYFFLLARNVRLALKCMQTSVKVLAISSLLFYGAIILIAISETVLIVPFQPSTSGFFITGLLCERAVRVARRRGYLNGRATLRGGLKAANATRGRSVPVPRSRY